MINNMKKTTVNIIVSCVTPPGGGATSMLMGNASVRSPFFMVKNLTQGEV